MSANERNPCGAGVDAGCAEHRAGHRPQRIHPGRGVCLRRHPAAIASPKPARGRKNPPATPTTEGFGVPGICRARELSVDVASAFRPTPGRLKATATSVSGFGVPEICRSRAVSPEVGARNFGFAILDFRFSIFTFRFSGSPFSNFQFPLSRFAFRRSRPQVNYSPG